MLTSCSIEHKLAVLQQQLRELVKDVADTEPLRARLLANLDETARAIRSPTEHIWQLMVQPHEYALIRIALELNIPEIIYQNGPRTTSQLAAETGAEELLLIRIMRSLAAMKIFDETAPYTYRIAPVSAQLAQDKRTADGVKFMWDIIGKSVFYLPEYLTQIKYKCPLGTPGAFELAFGKGTDFFSHIAKDQMLMQRFHNLMSVQRFRRPEWYEIFPVQQILIDGFDSKIGDTLLVDIGGSRGHELESFRRRFPHAAGNIVLQDLPHVVDSVSGLEEKGITKMAHNFFTEEPIKGARMYYMRSILHDWDDEKCREILRNIKPAMTKGYSRILINDWVIPDSGAAWYPCLQDINMMAVFSTMERSQSQVAALLESVGLKFVKLWGTSDAERCIEAMLEE